MDKSSSLKIIVIGLSTTSSWGNGHATTYRSLLRALNKRGHKILFLEQDTEWYSQNRDLVSPDYCKVEFYKNPDDLKSRFLNQIAPADLVIVGSYVNRGVEIGKIVLDNAEGLTAFYDIDTPVTLAKLEKGDYEYISPESISGYDLYLSFTGGPILNFIETQYGSPCAKPLYCSVDPDMYFPEEKEKSWCLGYLGTYSSDRQPSVKKFLIDTAEKMKGERFVIAGSQYPAGIHWSSNIERINHLPPSMHRNFYNSQKYTLNITRNDMIKAGYSPSVRLFEAAACGTPIISDYWNGIEEIFKPKYEILITRSTEETINYLLNIPEQERWALGMRARKKVLAKHTSVHRALELEKYFFESVKNKRGINI